MNLSAAFGKTLIDQLTRQGVTYFVLAPGLRVAPLAIAIAEHKKAETFVHFDERGAGFHALGYAKATGRPAAVIVTSGTAVGNLLPAVMEAEAACIPLIVLSCDRPHELRDTGANQTTDQIKVFNTFVRYQFDFPRPSAAIPPRFIATTIAQALLKSQHPLPGPVQLNLPFPEPFFDDQQTETFDVDPVEICTPNWICDQTVDLQNKRGVIILGSGGSCQEASDLAKRLNYPIFADIISGHREKVDPNSICYYHHILQSLPHLKVDTVIHVGGPYVSKTLLNWIKVQPEVIHVAKGDKRIDPHHVVTKRLFSCDEIVGEFIQGWLEKWKEYESTLEPCLGAFSEPAIVHAQLAEDRSLFFGNSMPIRDADLFFFPKQPRAPIFANRGLSGIDGNIATICGIAHEMPVTAVIGDQTLLHDLNSLAQIEKAKHPVQIILINNGGGGIFSFVASCKRQNLLDSYFAAAHDRTFEDIAKGFQLTYERASTIEQMQNSQAQFIEVTTNRQENHKIHLEIDAQLQKALCSSFSTVS